jgi:hypothetical protein
VANYSVLNKLLLKRRLQHLLRYLRTLSKYELQMRLRLKPRQMLRLTKNLEHRLLHRLPK